MDSLHGGREQRSSDQQGRRTRNDLARRGRIVASIYQAGVHNTGTDQMKKKGNSKRQKRLSRNPSHHLLQDNNTQKQRGERPYRDAASEAPLPERPSCSQEHPKEEYQGPLQRGGGSSLLGIGRKSHRQRRCCTFQEDEYSRRAGWMRCSCCADSQVAGCSALPPPYMSLEEDARGDSETKRRERNAEGNKETTADQGFRDGLGMTMQPTRAAQKCIKTLIREKCGIESLGTQHSVQNSDIFMNGRMCSHQLI